jgi:hypothetical protein
MMGLGLSSLCAPCGLAITYASSVPLRMGGTCGPQHVIAAGRGFESGQPDERLDVRDRNPGEAMSPSPQPLTWRLIAVPLPGLYRPGSSFKCRIPRSAHAAGPIGLLTDNP